MDPYVATRLVILIVLLFLSAFFSSAETAFTTVNKLRIRSKAEEGSKRAAIVSSLVENPSKLLSTILVGNNIVNISASSLATSLTMELFDSSTVGLVTGILTLLILIFGEITPKTFATAHSEKLSIALAPIFKFLIFIFTPVTFIVNLLASGVLRLFRFNPKDKPAAITENELLTIVDVSKEEGVIENSEHQMITNVVDFGDTVAKDVMVPCIHMKCVPDDISYVDLVACFREDEYSRMPVYSGTRDNIIGIIWAKDLLVNYNPSKPFNIKDYMREAFFTYEFKHTSELMSELRDKYKSLAIVLDEYGATAGLITIEDLLEEIVGEIRDEYDHDETDLIKKINDFEYEADGQAKLDDINEEIGLDIESDDYDSIAGHVIHLLSHLPSAGESVEDNNVLYTVLSTEKNRILRIKIQLSSPEEAAEE